MSEAKPQTGTVEGIDTKAEKEVWTGRPSQLTNIRAYVGCGLLCILGIVGISLLSGKIGISNVIIGILIWLPLTLCFALYRWLRVRCLSYELTNQRLRLHEGILTRRTEEMELYRVKDTAFSQTLFERVFGLGTIHLTTSDASNPEVDLASIPVGNAREVRERIRALTEQLRSKKRVREVDWN